MTDRNRREQEMRQRQNNGRMARTARLVLGKAPLPDWMTDKSLLPKKPPQRPKGPIE